MFRLPAHVLLAALVAIGPASYAFCPFGFLQSEWKNLRDVFTYWNPAVEHVTRVRVETLPDVATAEYPCNREHPIAGLDPAVRIDELAVGKEFSDARGDRWTVEEVQDEAGHIVATRGRREKKFPTQPARLPSRRYRFRLDDHTVEAIVPVDAPPKFISELEYSLRRLPKELIETLGQVRLNLQPFYANAHNRTTMTTFTTAGATARAGRGEPPTVDFYPDAYKNRQAMLEILRHELGHLIAWKLFGAMEPPAEWKDAMRDDGARARDGALPFSKYATNSPTEDFAEAVAYYLKYDGGAVAPGTRRQYEKRFALLDRYFAAKPDVKIEARARVTEWVFRRALAGLGIVITGLVGNWAWNGLGPTPTPTPVPAK